MAGEEQEEGKDTGKCKREGESGMEDGKEGLGKEGGACKYTAVVFCSIFQLMQDKKNYHKNTVWTIFKNYPCCRSWPKFGLLK